MSFKEQVEDLLRRRCLFRDCKTFAVQIGILTKDDFELATRLVNRMVALAKSLLRSVKGPKNKRHYDDYLKQLARSLNDCQVFERSWIEQNVFFLPPPNRRRMEDYRPREEQQDFRLQLHPDLPVQKFIERRDPTEEEMERRLLGTPQSDDDLGPDPGILLGTPTPARTTAQVNTLPGVHLGTAENTLPEVHQQQLPARELEAPLLEAPNPPAVPILRLFPTPPRQTRDSRQQQPAARKHLEPAAPRPPKPAAPRQLKQAAPRQAKPAAPKQAKPANPWHPAPVERGTHTADTLLEVAPAAMPVIHLSRNAPGREVRYEVNNHHPHEVHDASASSSHCPTNGIKRTQDRITVARCNLAKKQKQDQQEHKSNCYFSHCPHDASRYPKVHAFRYHVPEVFDERLPTTDPLILQLRHQALLQIGVWLMGRQAPLEELVELVTQQHLLDARNNANITREQSAAMVAFCAYLRMEPPRQFSLVPLNHSAVLLHWSAVMVMMALLGRDQQEYWRRRFTFPAMYVHLRHQDLPEAVDSHFHLDRLGRDSGLNTVEAILKAAPVEEDRQVQLVGAVANFCDPDRYPSQQDLQELPSQIIVAVGLHPKHASRSRSYINEACQKLGELLKSPRVAAVGEFGLDHSVKESDWCYQMEAVRKVAKHIRMDHVAVIHCRSMPDDDGLEVNALLISILRNELPSTQRMHVHAFCGTPYIRDRWLQTFSETRFSFNRRLCDFNEEQKDALRGMEEHRILLETDAPYFTRPGEPYSSPSQLMDAAEMVATVRQQPIKQVLEYTTANAMRFYLDLQQ